MSLDPLDRSMLVTLMAGLRRDGSRRRRLHAALERGSAAPPVGARRAARCRGHLGDDARATSISQQWRHLATLGRDHYVRVMYAGYLWPFGHAASLIKVTERKFESLDAGQLTQRVACCASASSSSVREPVRTYSGANHAFTGPQLPVHARRDPHARHARPAASPASAPARCSRRPGDASSSTTGCPPRMLFWPMVPAGAGQACRRPLRDRRHRHRRQAGDASPCRCCSSASWPTRRSRPTICASYNAAPAATKRRAVAGRRDRLLCAVDPADKGDPTLPTQTHDVRGGSAASDAQTAPELLSGGRDGAGRHQADPEAARPAGFHRRGRVPRLLQVARLRAPSQNAGQLFLKLTSVAEARRSAAAPDEAKSDALGRAGHAADEPARASRRFMGPVSGQRRRRCRAGRERAGHGEGRRVRSRRSSSRTRRCSAASSSREILTRSLTTSPAPTCRSCSRAISPTASRRASTGQTT